ncbi:MAG TPA: hypothetical protein VM848_17390 [Acidimicrobiia bacterium]|nr:hypothetical protein [Acidimicrobiia bacterium]
MTSATAPITDGQGQREDRMGAVVGVGDVTVHQPAEQATHRQAEAYRVGTAGGPADLLVRLENALAVF